MSNQNKILKKPANIELTRNESFLNGRLDAFDLLAASGDKHATETQIPDSKVS